MLEEFILQNKDVIDVSIQDTEFISLHNKGILVIASNNVRSYIFGSFIAVTIPANVKKYVTYQLLQLPPENPTKEESKEILANRPNFLKNLTYIDSLINNLGNFFS